MPPAGIRVTVEFPSSGVCPIAELSTSAETSITSRSTSVAPGSAESVSEFQVNTEDVPEGPAIEPVFSYGPSHLYRLEHGDEVSCPCECLGQYGCPVERYFADDGTLTLVFHASDYDQLRDVVAEFRERYPTVDIQRLVRSPTGETPQDNVFVDRGKLTDRQLEVLQTAYEMGYFERPRQANGTEVAAELGIDQSTFTEHLMAAQTKLLGDVLEEGA